MAKYDEMYKKYRYKSAFIFPVAKGERRGQYKVTAISIQRKYYPSLSAAKKAIDAWEKKQYKRDKRRF